MHADHQHSILFPAVFRTSLSSVSSEEIAKEFRTGAVGVSRALREALMGLKSVLDLRSVKTGPRAGVA